MDCSNIQFSLQKSKIDYQQLQMLFNQAAFWARERTIKDLKTAVLNSNPVVTIWDDQTMIGFCRGTSDGVYRATIWDVVIHKEYQGLGLGRKLVETALSHPLMSQVERVYLMTTYQQKFYQKIGFQENQSTTMVLQNTYDLNPISLGDSSMITEPKELDTVTV
ncbi:GNAT family N-acetyltransferase [Crocosphaera watsonii WH 8501]|uniref:GCN5-related N-acetyltransferase n=3 Tax=Crocosphaera watsonii TaxID=263511 RepID=Q4BXK2_CROWT|nr:GNAT family N-acetyltransferase [Crocosphaera watsonii]EAM48620.1 GCN5-related N-acetyltransferase [Crocosphaera watsonii WH 8501]CCQ49198.1 Acetyltransferase (GNAT) family, Syn7942_2240 homolog [Crocosphaera watsonii WH 8502]CCQ60988.1 Acetyltransferase (GNAT) family, Syn7942_2240 homolog [Crocosphaera watsonii WH 0401]